MDVNHVPIAVLSALPGFTPDLAARVIQARDAYGVFTLPQELDAFAELPVTGPHRRTCRPTDLPPVTVSADNSIRRP